MNVKLLGLLLALAVTTVSHAVEVRFLGMSPTVRAMNISLIEGESGLILSDLHDFHRTKPYDHIAANAPVKLRVEGKNNPDGTPALCSVALRGQAHSLIVILDAPILPAGIVAFAINDDESKFKYGAFVFFNACEEDMVFVTSVGKKSATIKVPHGSTPVLYTPPIIQGDLGVELLRAADLSKSVLTTLLHVGPDEQDFFFLFPSEDKGSGPYGRGGFVQSRPEPVSPKP